MFLRNDDFWGNSNLNIAKTKSNDLVNVSFEKNISNNNSTKENKSNSMNLEYYVIVASNYNSLRDG